jgi:hypothetical protein
MSELAPSPDELKQHAARHLAQAAKEADRDKAARHKQIADVFLKQAEAMERDDGERGAGG